MRAGSEARSLDGRLEEAGLERASERSAPGADEDQIVGPGAWAVRGEVCHGDKRGRLLGFPTANIRLGRHLEPARGVYAVTVRLPDGTQYPGVANIGRRPTVTDTLESRLEVNLFDFEGDLYGQELSVALHTLLRAERKFDGLEALAAQITLDAAWARDYLRDRAAQTR